MKVILTGASGMIGKGVLYECIDHPKITEIISIGRSELDVENPKLKHLIHSDFSDYSDIKDQLKGAAACYLCMGVSAAGMTEEKYTTITHEYTLALAKTVYELNPEATCTYVSGQGTDSTEKGRSMWARVKGKTENDILDLGFKQAFVYRPGAIIPLRGIKSRTKAYQFMYDYFMWLVKLIKFIWPKSVVNTTQIGLSMLNVTIDGYDKKILDPRDIIDSSRLK